MISCNGAPVLHSSPSGPWSNSITGWVPDFLAPDDILEIETRPIIHNPLGNRTARLGTHLDHGTFVSAITQNILNQGTRDGDETYTTGGRAHKVNSQPATMIARAGTRTIPRAVDLTDLPLVTSNHFLRSAHSMRLACADRGDQRRGIATSAATAAGNTALEVSGTGA